VFWYCKATDAGDADGMSHLARMYKSGLGGLPKDDIEWMKWTRKRQMRAILSIW